MRRVLSVCVVVALLAFVVGVVPGCVSSSESAEQQALTKNVGIYPDPPPGIDRPKVGVPPFLVTAEKRTADLGTLAADQLTSLAVNTDRFDVIERAQLEQLLKEQGYEGIVRADELAQPGMVRGVDLLFLGKVTNFRIKKEKSAAGFGLGALRIPGGGGIGAFDYENKNSTITVECGVDIRLVDAESGSIATAQSADYKRTDSIGAIGVDILGVSAGSDADLEIDEDNMGLILRLALDKAVKDMIPKLDRFLVARTKEVQQSDPPETTDEDPAEPATAGKNFCGDCGAKLAAGSKFCGECGEKVQ